MSTDPRIALSIYTVFENPKDFPGLFVVRRFDVVKGKSIATNWVHSARTLEQVRLLIPQGTVMLARHPEDDATIVETWL